MCEGWRLIVNKLRWMATAAFGLEGIVARELRSLGIEARAENGGALFEGTLEEAFRANLHLRCSDRVLLLMAEFEARSFAELFDQVRFLSWETFLSAHSAFPVTGNCVRSQLMSISDCQKIIKKAVVERLKERYHLTWLPEDRENVAIRFHIHQNRVRIFLDSSGTSLNRRGYRTLNAEAPIRETLAAALILLSPWHPGMPFVDPFCGSGTLPIEAAMIQSRRAPGLTRSFAMENWPNVDTVSQRQIREEARSAFEPERVREIYGSDIDPEAVSLSRFHLKQAGLDGRVYFSVSDMAQQVFPAPSGMVLCNPPYGERLMDRRSCEQLYARLGQHMRTAPGWNAGIITSHPAFERFYGSRATRKRRFYNGRLECEFMLFSARKPKN